MKAKEGNGAQCGAEKDEIRSREVVQVKLCRIQYEFNILQGCRGCNMIIQLSVKISRL